MIVRIAVPCFDQGMCQEETEVNGFKFFNPKVSRAPLSCGDNCFRLIRDLSDFISFPEVRNDSRKQSSHERGARDTFGLKNFNSFK